MLEKEMDMLEKVVAFVADKIRTMEQKGLPEAVPDMPDLPSPEEAKESVTGALKTTAKVVGTGILVGTVAAVAGVALLVRKIKN